MVVTAKKIILLFLVVGVGALFFGVYRFNEYRIADSRKSLRASQDLKLLCIDVELVAAMNPELAFFKGTKIWSVREFFKAVVEDPYFSSDDRYRQSAQNFLDPWGRDYQMQVRLYNGVPTVVLWSDGPEARFAIA